MPALDGPAIDAGAANGLTADQRGLARTVRQPGTSGGDGTDIGAVELADGSVDGAGLKIKKKQKIKGKKIVVKVKVSAEEAVTATGSGTVKLGKKKLALTKPKLDVAAGKGGTLKLKPKGKKATKKIAKALAQGEKAKASVQVTFVDAAGNQATLKGRAKLEQK